MANGLLTTLSLLSQNLKLDLASRCFVDLWVGRDLVGKDGSLARVIRVDGLKEMRSFLDLETFLNRASKALNSPLKQRGRAIQIWYERNPDLAAATAAELTREPRLNAKILGLDAEILLDDRETYLAKRLVPDVLYFVLWTRRGILTPYEIKELKNAKRPTFWPKSALSQDLLRAVPALRIKHNAWCEDIVDSLKKLGLVIRELNGHESVAALRRNFRPNSDHRHFKPWLPGDPITPDQTGVIRAPETRVGLPPDDMSHFLWPMLPPIIVDDTDARVISGRLVRLGERFYAPLEMSLGPQDQQPFSRLFDRLADENIPWRMSVLLEGSGLKDFQLKRLLAVLSGWSSQETALIHKALKNAADMEVNGVAILRTQIAFATWANTIQQAESRQAKLQQAVETWGSCVTSTGGDPMTLAFSTMVGLDPASAATSGLSSIKAGMRYLPWSRNASPFDNGSITFVTEENTPWNWTPGNRSQGSAVEFLIGPPGSGKSVTMSTLAMAYILGATSNPQKLARLPRYSLLDIGPSSRGLIESLRAMLPPERREEAQYHRLTLDPEYSINPFDLQPGLRQPIGYERSFLINFLSLLVTPIGEKGVPVGLAELAGQVIDEAYQKFNDDPRFAGTPKLWSKGEDPALDEMATRLGIPTIVSITTWFDLVDEFHRFGRTEEAILAQRYAVPRLSDLMAIVRSSSIETLWGEAKLPNGENLITVFWRAISTALREYPVFAAATRFSIGRARVISLDLQQVTGGSGDANDKRTAIMYMLGRFVLTRDRYVSDDTITKASDLWVDWHRQRAQEVKETPCRFGMDEYHRASKAPSVQDQIILDMREGRKFGIQIILGSQLDTDFTPEMLDLVTFVYVCGVNNDDGARRIARIFDLSEAAYTSIASFLLGPGRRGAPFLALINMKDGKHEHKLFNVVGPTEIWAYSSSPDDVALRSRVSSLIGFGPACTRLGRMYPNGSAEDGFKEARENRQEANPFDVVLQKVMRSVELLDQPAVI